MSRTSRTHIDHFNVIVPVLWKMDEACVGAERDQLILRKQTMAVKDGTVIRGIELSLDLCWNRSKIACSSSVISERCVSNVWFMLSSNGCLSFKSGFLWDLMPLFYQSI